MHRTEDPNNVNNHFTETPPRTSIGADIMNAIQDEIVNVILGEGIPLKTAATETSLQLKEAIDKKVGGSVYNATVTEQIEFNAIFTRVSANEYKINDGIKSLLIAPNATGYLVSGILSGGDSWGNIKTNECARFTMWNGANIHFSNFQGHVHFETANAINEGIIIAGQGTVGSLISESFKIGNSNMTFINCKTRNRRSDIVDFAGFRGTGVASIDDTVKFIGCSVFQLISGVKIYGFKDCKNLTACSVVNLESFNDSAIGFSDAYSMSACVADQLLSRGSGDAIGFSNCLNASGTNYAKNLAALGSGTAREFYQCGFKVDENSIAVDALTGHVGVNFTPSPGVRMVVKQEPTDTSGSVYVIPNDVGRSIERESPGAGFGTHDLFSARNALNTETYFAGMGITEQNEFVLEMNQTSAFPGGKVFNLSFPNLAMRLKDGWDFEMGGDGKCLHEGVATIGTARDFAGGGTDVPVFMQRYWGTLPAGLPFVKVLHGISNAVSADRVFLFGAAFKINQVTLPNDVLLGVSSGNTSPATSNIPLRVEVQDDSINIWRQGTVTAYAVRAWIIYK